MNTNLPECKTVQMFSHKIPLPNTHANGFNHLETIHTLMAYNKTLKDHIDFLEKRLLEYGIRL